MFLKTCKLFFHFSQKNDLGLLVLNSMELRKQEKEKEIEEKIRLAGIEKKEREEREKREKEEKEKREKIELEERRRREEREEKRLAMEREDRDRRDLMMYKLMGLEREKRSIKKQIKVQMFPCDSHNLALPTKLTLSTIQALKRYALHYLEYNVT